MRISFIKILILIAAAVISVVYVSYLYIVAKRKDFAIMRALGTSKRRASYSLVLPLSVISSIAVALGTVSALVYTRKTISDSETLKLLESESINTTIPVEAVALCVLGVFALCIAAAAIMLIFFSIITCMMHGVNNVITSIAPLRMRNKIDSGKLAGILNGFCYVGSTLSSYGLGAVADKGGWQTVFYLIFISCVISIILGILYWIKSTLSNKNEIH